MKLFRRSCDERGQTILLVTHNPRDASFADEVHFIKDGEMPHEHSLGQGEVTPEAIADRLETLAI